MSVVQSIVGHSNPAMTRHYTHVSEYEAAKAIASLPDVTGGTNFYNEPLPAWARDLLKKMTAKELPAHDSPAPSKIRWKNIQKCACLSGIR